MASVGPPPKLAAAEGEIQQALESGAAREAMTLPAHLRHLPERNQAQQIELTGLFARQEYELRRMYARGILFLLGIEIVIANAVFVIFAAVGEHWKLDTAVIDVWLAATVVQIVGVVHVVTRHLFPESGGKPAVKA